MPFPVIPAKAGTHASLRSYDGEGERTRIAVDATPNAAA
jgi:hypothetical protein